MLIVNIVTLWAFSDIFIHFSGEFGELVPLRGQKEGLLGLGGGTTSLVSHNLCHQHQHGQHWHISPCLIMRKKIIKRGEKSGCVEKSCIKSRGIDSYLVLRCLLEQLQSFGQR